MSHAVVRGLRARGVDVVTAWEEGMIERRDEEHLDYATNMGRVLYSFNVADFHQLHRRYLSEGKHHTGIILTRQQPFSVGGQLRGLLKLIANVPAEDMTDRVEFLSAWA